MQLRALPRVLVVGAGLSGLACAHRLRELGAEVALLEAADQPGGVLRTTRENGYVLEHGPDAWATPAPAVGALARELGVESDVVAAPPLDRFVLRRGRLAALPRGPKDILRTRALSPLARLRLLVEPLVGRAEAEESVAAFVRRRLGRGAGDLADALVTGVVAGDPARTSLDEAFPSVRALEREHGSLFRAVRAIAHGGAHGGGEARGLATMRAGMQSLVDALARKVEPVCRTPVESLAREGDRWTAVTPRGAYTADRVVVALPAARAAKIVPDASWPLPREAPVAIVGLGYDEADASVPQGYGYLAPEGERHRILGAVFASRAFPARAPEGKVLLRCMVGGVRHPERAWAPAEEVVRAARESLESVGLVRGEPAWTRVVRVPAGIPQLELGHARLRAAVRASELANPGLRVVGWGYRGVAMPHCVAEARAVAEETVGA